MSCVPCLPSTTFSIDLMSIVRPRHDLAAVQMSLLWFFLIDMYKCFVSHESLCMGIFVPDTTTIKTLRIHLSPLPPSLASLQNSQTQPAPHAHDQTSQPPHTPAEEFPHQP